MPFDRLTHGLAAFRHVIVTLYRSIMTMQMGGWKMVILAIFGLLIIGAIGWGVSGTNEFVKSLQDITIARGLITFLVVITTMGIALILTISTTVFGTPADLEDKLFDRGKQVLTVLIGVLGTIVGFYFGSSPDSKSSQTTMAKEPQTLAIAPANLSDQQPKNGEKITISSFVSGGKGPYSYSITFSPPRVISDAKDIESTDGFIKQEFAVPETLDADKDVKYQIHVTDSDNNTADYNKDGTQKISLKAK